MSRSTAVVRLRRVAMVALGALMLVVMRPDHVPAQDGAQDRQYRLGPGDEIVVTVYGQKDLSGEFRLDGGGRISLPLIGDVHVGGLTVREAEAAVADELHPDYLRNPRVSLQVMNYRPFYILGEVKEPGSYPYVNGMTVVQAVALAGGFTYRASQDDVEIIRGGNRDRAKEKARQDTPVMPGDIIEVPERFF